MTYSWKYHTFVSEFISDKIPGHLEWWLSHEVCGSRWELCRCYQWSVYTLSHWVDWMRHILLRDDEWSSLCSRVDAVVNQLNELCWRKTSSGRHQCYGQYLRVPYAPLGHSFKRGLSYRCYYLKMNINIHTRGQYVWWMCYVILP